MGRTLTERGVARRTINHPADYYRSVHTVARRGESRSCDLFDPSTQGSIESCDACGTNSMLERAESEFFLSTVQLISGFHGDHRVDYYIHVMNKNYTRIHQWYQFIAE